MRSNILIAFLALLVYLFIEYASGSELSSPSVVKNDVKVRPLLQSFTPKGSKVISAHGRNDATLRSTQKQGYLRVFFRVIRLLAIFSPNILTAWLAILIPPLQGIWFRMLSVSLAYSGAAFIKWGQVKEFLCIVAH